MGKLVAIVLLLVLPIGGFVNYRRNAPLDQELENRTYANLPDDDLAALIEAYEGEARRLSGLVSNKPQGEDELDGYSASDYDGKVKAFRTFQQYNSQWRRARGELFEQEAALEELRREQSIRERGLDKPWKRILRRVLHF